MRACTVFVAACVSAHLIGTTATQEAIETSTDWPVGVRRPVLGAIRTRAAVLKGKENR